MSYIEIVKMFLPYHMVSSTAAGSACAWEMLKCRSLTSDVTVTQCHAGARDMAEWKAPTVYPQGMEVTSFWQFWSVPCKSSSSTAYSHFVQLLLPGFYYWRALNIRSFNKPMITARISCASSHPQNKGKTALICGESWLVMESHTYMQVYLSIHIFARVNGATIMTDYYSVRQTLSNVVKRVRRNRNVSKEASEVACCTLLHWAISTIEQLSRFLWFHIVAKLEVAAQGSTGQSPKGPKSPRPRKCCICVIQMIRTFLNSFD